jgi:NADP-dependent 3-hydroxy acid dehydrogenase YdfG
MFLGRTVTPMQAKMNEMECKAYQPERFSQPEDIATIVKDVLALPRTSEITDINIRPSRKFD